MQNATVSRARLTLVTCMVLTIACGGDDHVAPVQSQPLTQVEQIRDNLLSNPPNTGDREIRKENILALDEILISDSVRTSRDVRDLYDYMMTKVAIELRSPVDEGARVWLMYNHGFIVKTPDLVFAFDVISGYWGWNARLPIGLIDRIKVLFVSHEHADHVDSTVIRRVLENGGHVVYPTEIQIAGNVPMAAGYSLELEGLQIRAHSGLHADLALRIFEVVAPRGLRFLHTGDNQTSETLPRVDDLDVLLLNAWVNESGAQSPAVGICNSVNKLNPRIVLPGHIQELGHDYIPGDVTSRLPYKAVYEVADASVAARMHVMIWGELYVVPEKTP